MSAHSIPWRRVTRAAKCPVCGRDSWCCVGDRYVNCMRVQSDKRCDNGGWLHPLGTQWTEPPRREEPAPTFNVVPLYLNWVKHTEDRHIDILSRLLAIEELPLRALGVAWAEEHGAWAFPMVNADREITGIRLRNEKGEKWAVRGGKNGLFVSRSKVPPNRRCYICEGPTDTAALLSIGLFAVGRPSCNEGGAILTELLPRLGVWEAVIVADHDGDKHAPDGRTYNPGVDGALSLSERIPVRNCIWLPPTKDAREFVKCGGTAVQVENAVKSVQWNVKSTA